MIRAFLLWLLTVTALHAQEVAPDDVHLRVFLNDGMVTPYHQELVLLTIEGTYRRRIATEQIEQPPLTGFNWMQLGEDYWWDDRENGVQVKKFRRRMALFPDQVGELEIGPFTHHLNLFDENDDWFEYSEQSEPITLDVKPIPELAEGEWWLPLRSLEISDQWSNAPDQLDPGEGVLRVIRIEATGVSPEMIPPMPDMTSPSGGVFPHPEKRLVDLTPDGPVTLAFWRWTIQPLNGRSAVVEPIELAYFDTTTRRHEVATITANRVAFRDEGAAVEKVFPAYALRSGLHWIVLGAVLVGAAAGLWTRRRTL